MVVEETYRIMKHPSPRPLVGYTEEGFVAMDGQDTSIFLMILGDFRYAEEYKHLMKNTLPFPRKVVSVPLTKLLNRLFNGTFAVKGRRLNLQRHVSVIGCLANRRSPSLVRTLRFFLLHFGTIASNNGIPFLVKYLKALNVITMQSVGGMKVPSTRPFGVAIARTKTGLPRIIPSVWRDRMRRGDVIAIRIILTIFSIYRIIEIPGKANLKTITNPGPSLDFSGIMPRIEHFWSVIPWKSGEPAEWKLDFFPSYSSASTSGVYGMPQVSTSVWSIVQAIRSLTHNCMFKTLNDISALYSGLCLFDLVSKWPIWSNKSIPIAPLGKLGFKLESAGKVRVFAMVDPFTNWVLYPLHKAIFQSLRLISQDGTFDQHKPIYRLLEQGHTRFWCYDLSAATDRLPVLLQALILSIRFGFPFGRLWARLLVRRDYCYPASLEVGVDKPGKVRYSVGQPMGALSSWAMLALTHHFIIQWAFWRCHEPLVIVKGGLTSRYWFRDYAILGDDIVIANGRVAREYVSIMKWLGVEIGFAKSLLSRKGCLEFAKKFFVRGSDCSPLPYKEYMAAVSHLPSLLEFQGKYSLTLSQVVRAKGYGFRVLGNLTRSVMKQSKKLRNLILLMKYPQMSIRDWFSLSLPGSNWPGANAKYFRYMLQLLNRKFSKKMLTYKEHYDLCFMKGSDTSHLYRPRLFSIEMKDGWLQTPVTENLVSAKVGSEIVRTLFETSFREVLNKLVDVRSELTQIELISRELGHWDPSGDLTEVWKETFTSVLDSLDELAVPNLTQDRVYVEKPPRSSIWLVKLWLQVNQSLRESKEDENRIFPPLVSVEEDNAASSVTKEAE